MYKSIQLSLPRVLIQALFLSFLAVLILPGFPVSFAEVKEPTPAFQFLPVALTVRSVPVAETVVIPQTSTIDAPVIISEPALKMLVARLLIPKIGVNAIVREMGLTSEGDMAVPDSRVDVGWYSPGTRPGQTGSAVIGGHNVWKEGSAAFVRLDQLVTGDILHYVDAHGVSTSFVVRETRTYNPSDDATAIFTSPSGAHLNLITCSGVFDPATDTSTKRLIVFADLVLPAEALE